MTEEVKKDAVVQKPAVNAIKELAAAKKPSMTDEEVWLKIYCAAVSANVNATSRAKSIATAGLAEFKAHFAK